MLGNVAWKTKKKSMHTQDLSMEMHRNERGESIFIPLKIAKRKWLSTWLM